MKKFILVVITFCFLSGISYSQITIPEKTSLFGLANQIAKITVIKNKKEGTPSYDYGTYAIGKEFIPGSLDTTVKIYRTYFEFDLNAIPTNATITQVTINFSTGNIGSYSLKLTQVTSVSTDKGASWNAVASGTSLHTGIAYNGNSFVSTPIKDAMENSLAGRKLIIGALS